MLDFGDVVVHVMSEEMRSYYDMESFYDAAEEVRLRLPASDYFVQNACINEHY